MSSPVSDPLCSAGSSGSLAWILAVRVCRSPQPPPCHDPCPSSEKEWWAGAKVKKVDRGLVMAGGVEGVWWSSVVPGSYLVLRWQLVLPMVRGIRI